METAPRKIPPTKIIWTALLISQVMLFVIANLNSKGKTLLPPNPDQVKILPIVAGVIWLVAIGIPKFLKRENQGQIFMSYLLQWALFEAVSLIGFTIASTTFDPHQMLPFWLAGLGGHLFRFPVGGQEVS